MEIQKQHNLIIGRGTLRAGSTYIIPGDGVVFGNFCAVGPGLQIINTNHQSGYAALQYTFYKRYFDIKHPGVKHDSKGIIKIGSDVWFGQDVKVLSGAKIGDGCVIGAGSIVTREMPPYTICAGIPCRPIKPRFEKQTAEFLQQLKWWEWSDDRIKQNREFFEKDLSKLSLEQIKNLIR